MFSEDNNASPDPLYPEQSLQNIGGWVETQGANGLPVLLEGASMVHALSNQSTASGLQWPYFASSIGDRDDLRTEMGDGRQYMLPADVLGLQYQSSEMNGTMELAAGDYVPPVSAVNGQESSGSPILPNRNGGADVAGDEGVLPNQAQELLDSFCPQNDKE
jgi:hypothetical protein